MNELVLNFNLKSAALGHLTSVVQFGFILGTLVFAIFTIADRFSPSKVFFSCALLGAITNTVVIWDGNNLESLLALRFMTGFFLAGIYPVGMKIAADYFDKGLGKSLGLLVGALVIGTAFPHLAKELTHTFQWQYVIILTSTLAIIGGTAMSLLVKDGPYRNPSHKTDFSACFEIFRNRKFRAAALGYFGHMWELYAFWTFVPVILKTYSRLDTGSNLNIPILSFLIIGLGGVACVITGYLSQVWGAKRLAIITLLLSGLCCLASPFFLTTPSVSIFIAFLVFWGMVVIADSPLFSTIVAQNAPSEIKATALTIVNCIGFSVTIISIQMLNYLQSSTAYLYMYMLLALGPFLGLIALWASQKETIWVKK